MGNLEGEHLRHLRRRNLRPSTIDQRRRALHRLGRNLDVTLATTGEIENWLDDRDLQPEGRATEISHLRGFYRWAVGEGLLDRDPTLKLARPRIPRRLPRPMPEGDLAVAVELAGEPVRSMLMLAAFAGLRAIEIAGLHGEHVHLEQGVILVAEGKGGGMSSVPIAPTLATVLRGLARSGPCFHLLDGRQMQPHNVSHRCNQFLHGVGISHTLHSLRHRFGTQAYIASGRDLRATQELLRHSTPASSAKYTWVDPGDLTTAVGRLPIVGQQDRLPW